jgi:hypothetical protein
METYSLANFLNASKSGSQPEIFKYETHFNNIPPSDVYNRHLSNFTALRPNGYAKPSAGLPQFLNSFLTDSVESCPDSDDLCLSDLADAFTAELMLKSSDVCPPPGFEFRRLPSAAVSSACKQFSSCNVEPSGLSFIEKTLTYPATKTYDLSSFMTKNDPLTHQSVLECVNGADNGGELIDLSLLARGKDKSKSLCGKTQNNRDTTQAVHIANDSTQEFDMEESLNAASVLDYSKGLSCRLEVATFSESNQENETNGIYGEMRVWLGQPSSFCTALCDANVSNDVRNNRRSESDEMGSLRERFLYKNQSGVLSSSLKAAKCRPAAKWQPYKIVMFDFSTASPDDIAKNSQRKAFG